MQICGAPSKISAATICKAKQVLGSRERNCGCNLRDIVYGVTLALLALEFVNCNVKR
jgi:hypothetical protein